MRRFRKIVFLLSAAALAVTGCLGDEVSQTGAASQLDPPEDCDCTPIDDGDIGLTGLEVGVGELQVTFSRWIEKSGSPGEYVGFEATTKGGQAAFYIKAGVEKFAVGGRAWAHPAGADAQAITTLDVCETHPPDSPPDDGPIFD